MATRLYLRDTHVSAITSRYADLLTAAGAASVQSFTDTAAVDTQVQVTEEQTLDQVIQWVSGRAPSGGFTLTTATLSVWCRENVAGDNAKIRARVFKRSGVTDTEIGGGPFDGSAEYGTSYSEHVVTCNVTDTVFAENDRIVLKLYHIPVGTFGAGGIARVRYNGAVASSSESYFEIAETVTFKTDGLAAAAQEVIVSLSGGIHNRLRLFVSGTATFRVLIQATDDGGATFFTTEQIASSVVEADVDRDLHVNGAFYEGSVPSLGRILMHAVGGTLSYVANYVMGDASVEV